MTVDRKILDTNQKILFSYLNAHMRRFQPDFLAISLFSFVDAST